MADVPADAPISVKPGDTLGGKFHVERVLGEGGMGVVVAATHLGLGQLVALKFMLRAAMRYPENVARFEREARAAVRLKSEHVARVSDVGRLDSGAPYMVMEYLEGEDLDRYLEAHGRLPIETAVDFVLQACEAVAEAHALGIVHRDLKPKNLFLTKRVNGRPLVKVLDFGISKSTGPEDMSLTGTSQVLGSPNYMSPEQLRSARDADARSDIWALGTILYELLSGRVPFLAESVTQLTAMVLQDTPPSLAALRPDVPPGLVDVVTKCLEKRREERVQSVTELVGALAPFASEDGASLAKGMLGPAPEPSAPRLTGPPSSLRVSTAGVNTESAWDRTQLAPSTLTLRKRRARLIAAVAAAVACFGIGGFVIFRHNPQPVTTPGVPGSVSVQTPTPPPPSVATLPTLPAAPSSLPLVPPVGSSERHPPPVVNTGQITRPVISVKPDAGAPPVTVTARDAAAPPVVDDGPPKYRN